ncbi:NmrA family NAD(P)-binding protein [[Mycobacterium] kokjensenii]|uniref:NmrA family NAD(P)-binding protein n=1 Tax=[Mycobacterium] kokjensenii TaxID=3064287 RepID=A0ABN9NGV9_9MYCO|nr:NmrA family NAD(P)-binding protein [Mycolicibacter sp. MU0083]CAJ1506132.1 NmrA family NAD(P)-binding protein [Mycolicibacter sp. MU0083]
MSTTAKSGPVAVIGATGQQGAATVDALLERGRTVRALVRNPAGAAARALADRGVEVVAADLDAPSSIEQAFAGVAGAFAMTTFGGAEGTAGEVRHGRIIGDAARAAGLPLLVYSSVGGAERRTGIPHFDSKWQVEEYLRPLVPLNVLRPTFFMENLRYLVRRDGDRVRLALPLPAGIPLQMVAVADIGRTAAALLDAADPTAAPIEIAGDELTGEQMADAIGTALGIPTDYAAAPLDVLGDDEDGRTMFSWFTRLPAYRADFARTARLVPGVENFAAWLQRNPILG